MQKDSKTDSIFMAEKRGDEGSGWLLPVSFLDSTMMPRSKALALYVHVPFCKAKCTYCDFFSVVGREKDIPTFIRMLVQEIRVLRQRHDLSGHRIETIFFGGGTPNLLSPDQLALVLSELKKLTDCSMTAEVGMEINPGEASASALRDYRAAGVNRISIGMQSFHPDLLRFMSRIHSVDQSFETYDWVRKAGFENVSADLIFAVPGQTSEMWLSDLKQLVDLAPEHISTYSLTVEEGTALSRWVNAGHVQMMEESVDTGMYDLGRDFLESRSYMNYEISNFALAGFECRHNLNYWTGVEYLGVGPAAHSLFSSRRHWNVRDLDLYHRSIDLKGHAEEGSEVRTVTSALNETILTELRLARGLDLHQLVQEFKTDLLVSRKAELSKWQHMLQVDHGRLKLTPNGWALVDEITADLMFPED